MPSGLSDGQHGSTLGANPGLAPASEPGVEELEQVAQSLALLGSFGNPYLHPSGPTAHVAPGIPLLFGMIYAIFGIGWQGELVKRLLAALVCSIQYALLPRVAIALRLPRLTGAIAGLLAALIPYKGFIETTDSPWEQPYVALALLLLFLHTVGTALALSSDAERVLRNSLWGLATLISPMLGLVFAAVILYGLRAEPPCRIGRCCGIRRDRRHGSCGTGFNCGLVLSRSNFGIEFRLSTPRKLR